MGARPLAAVRGAVNDAGVKLNERLLTKNARTALSDCE